MILYLTALGIFVFSYLRTRLDKSWFAILFGYEK